jgi:hypothetical protein
LFVGNLNLSLIGSIEIAEKDSLPAFCGSKTTGCIDRDPVSFHSIMSTIFCHFTPVQSLPAHGHRLGPLVSPEKISLQYFAKGYRSQCPEVKYQQGNERSSDLPET